jgi:hypothetical protein
MRLARLLLARLALMSGEATSPTGYLQKLSRPQLALRTARNGGNTYMTNIARGATPRKEEGRPKRKNGTFWYEDGGRYLCRYGPTGITIFDSWNWTGEPLPRRRA